ncbi:MAG: DUF3619 family protein [Gammaproteobacteria bacterium]
MTIDRQNSREDAFIEKVKNRLEEQNAALPAHVSSRLTQARHAAVDAYRQAHRDESRAGQSRARTWALAAGVAAVAIAAAVFVYAPGETELTLVPVAEISDIEILFDEDDLELYEDLDFYLWLAYEADADVG